MSTRDVHDFLVFADGLLGPHDTGLFAFDTRGRIIFWNAGMERISSMAPEAVLGRSILEVYPSLDEAPDRVLFDKALAGESVTSRDRLSWLAELEEDFVAFFSPIRSDDRDVVGGAVLLRAITPEKLAQDRLRETEDRFKSMADIAPVLLWMSGTDTLCTFFNQSWLDFTGRTLEEEWGIGWAEGVHFEDLQRCLDGYIAAFNARSVFEMEYRLRRHDGEYRWILDRGTPRYMPDGTFAGYIGSCVDITERKRLETELMKAVRDRDDFLSVASHELRTPLTTLSLEIDSLQRSLSLRTTPGPDEEQVARGVEASRTQTARLVTLVGNLLDVSRIANGNFEIRPSRFDLADLVKDVIASQRPSLRIAGCPIELTLAESTGTWDRQRIEQVVTNLLSNAMKYGAGKAIAVRILRGRWHVSLEVQDRGIGIEKANQARIFQRFERVAPATPFPGFGLGLWIAREIVIAHGGSIEVESVPHEGATFRVRLPLRDTASAP